MQAFARKIADIFFYISDLNSAYANSKEQAENQLRLALAWNQSSIADTQILTDSQKISSDVLVNIFLDAIKQVLLIAKYSKNLLLDLCLNYIIPLP